MFTVHRSFPNVLVKVRLTLSRVFHLFLKNRGGSSVTVVGKRRNKGIGLEIPATYTFQHKKPLKLNKLRETLKEKDNKDNKYDDTE